MNSQSKFIINRNHHKNIYRFKILVQDLKKHKDSRGQDLDSLLVKPIQRLPKYVLLLKDLLKHTDKIHIDYDNIVQSLKLIEQVNN